MKQDVFLWVGLSPEVFESPSLNQYIDPQIVFPFIKHQLKPA